MPSFYQEKTGWDPAGPSCSYLLTHREQVSRPKEAGFYHAEWAFCPHLLTIRGDKEASEVDNAN